MRLLSFPFLTTLPTMVYALDLVVTLPHNSLSGCGHVLLQAGLVFGAGLGAALSGFVSP